MENREQSQHGPSESTKPTSAGAQGQGRASTAASGDPSSASRGGGSTSAMSGDRERSIATSREDTSGRGETSTEVETPRRSQSGLARSGTLSPFTLMRRLSEEMDRMFGDLSFGGLGLFPDVAATHRGRTTGGGSLMDMGLSGWVPALDIVQRENDLLVSAELPGLSKDDIKVEVQDGMLTLSGHRHQEHEENMRGMYRSERSYGSFFRAIPLPEDADTSQAQAKYRDGILEITIPTPQRQHATQPRKLEVTG